MPILWHKPERMAELSAIKGLLKDLAATIGLTPEVLYRTLAQLELTTGYPKRRRNDHADMIAIMSWRT